MFRASIKLRDKPVSAKALRPSTIMRIDGRKVEVQIDDIHEVVLVHY